MTVSTLDTQSDSFRSISPRKLAQQQQDILDVIETCCGISGSDLSLAEIQRAYERIYERRIDVGRVSARVSNLIAGGRLYRKVDTRACTVTGRQVHPVFPVQKQKGLAI